MSTAAQPVATTVSTVAAMAGVPAGGGSLAWAARAAATAGRVTAVAGLAAATAGRVTAVAGLAAATAGRVTAVAGLAASSGAATRAVNGAAAQRVASGVIGRVATATSAVSRYVGRVATAFAATAGRIVLESPQGLVALVRSALATAREALAIGLAQLRRPARDDLRLRIHRLAPALTIVASRDEREGPRAVSSGYGTVAQGNGPPLALVRAA